MCLTQLAEFRRNPKEKQYQLLRLDTHFSTGSREQVQDSGSQAPLWSETLSHSNGLSEEQAYETSLGRDRHATPPVSSTGSILALHQILDP